MLVLGAMMVLGRLADNCGQASKNKCRGNLIRLVT
jgi:hypothetical protein